MTGNKQWQNLEQKNVFFSIFLKLGQIKENRMGKLLYVKVALISLKIRKYTVFNGAARVILLRKKNAMNCKPKINRSTMSPHGIRLLCYLFKQTCYTT